MIECKGKKKREGKKESDDMNKDGSRREKVKRLSKQAIPVLFFFMTAPLATLTTCQCGANLTFQIYTCDMASDFFYALSAHVFTVARSLET